jgi:TM2 domain-containing membrane protein YozV
MKKNLSLFSVLLSFGVFLGSCSKNIAPFQKSSTVAYEAKSKSIPVLELNELDPNTKSVDLGGSSYLENSISLSSSTDASFGENINILPQLPTVSNSQKLNLSSSVVVANELNSSGKNLTFKQIKELKKVQKQIKKKSTLADGKSQLVALILAIFVGVIGIHRFYLGYTTYGILQLLTGGGCGIWALIDLIRIATGDLKPNGGDYSEKL